MAQGITQGNTPVHTNQTPAPDHTDLTPAPDHTDLTPTTRRFLLILNIIILTVGFCGGPQLMRLYFVQGGRRIWFTTFLQSVAFPMLLIPFTFLYRRRRLRGQHGRQENGKEMDIKFFTIKLPLIIGSACIGVLSGLGSYLLSYGVSRLPVSTSALIIATQLAFTALFAFLLVKQKFTSYSINAVFLLLIGSVILGLRSNSDRPPGVTKHDYYAAFFVTVAAAVLNGFVMPAIELTLKKGRQIMTYGLVLEVQMVIGLAATLFAMVGMLLNKDFQAIPREAREYGLGEVRYYIVVVWTAIFLQCMGLGAIGVIFCSSSLLSGVIVSMLLPVTEALAIIIFKEKFQAEKGVALVLSLWGFVSYFRGEMLLARKLKKNDPRSIQGENNLELASNNVV